MHPALVIFLGICLLGALLLLLIVGVDLLFGLAAGWRERRWKGKGRRVPPLVLALGLLVSPLWLRPTRADEPTAPVLAPAGAQLTTPPPALPAPVLVAPAPLPSTSIPTPDDLAKAQQVTQVAATALHQLQQVLGIPTPTLPPAWYDTSGGKVVVWGSFGLGVATTVTGIVLGAIAASRSSP